MMSFLAEKCYAAAFRQFLICSMFVYLLTNNVEICSDKCTVCLVHKTEKKSKCIFVMMDIYRGCFIVCFINYSDNIVFLYPD